MIKAIFIDFYGTVVYEDGGIVHKISHLIFETGNAQSESEVDSFWWNRFRTSFENSYGKNFQTQRALERQALADTIEHFHSSENADERSREMFEFWMHPTIFEESKQFFRECPLPIYIVSNIDRMDILEALHYHDLHPQDVITSEDAKSYKPRKEIFESALHKAGLEAHEVIHIGDSLNSDVKGANAVGIHPIWLNRSGKTVPGNVTAVSNLMDIFTYI